MSRASQFYWAVNAKDYPDGLERLVRYTDLEFTDEVARLIKRLRRELAKDRQPEKNTTD